MGTLAVTVHSLWFEGFPNPLTYNEAGDAGYRTYTTCILMFKYKNPGKLFQR
jgi:hypothetical protein